MSEIDGYYQANVLKVYLDFFYCCLGVFSLVITESISSIWTNIGSVFNLSLDFGHDDWSFSKPADENETGNFDVYNRKPCRHIYPLDIYYTSLKRIFNTISALPDSGDKKTVVDLGHGAGSVNCQGISCCIQLTSDPELLNGVPREKIQRLLELELHIQQTYKSM